MLTESWGLDQAHRLSELYQRQTRSLPFHDLVPPEEFTAGMEWSQAPQLIDHADEQFAVSHDDGDVIAFAHIGTSRPRDSDEEHGLIRFLCYEPGRPAAGKAVLEAAEEVLRSRGVSRIVAFRIWHGYRYYHVGRGFLVDRWPHVLGLLQCHGYVLEEEGILLGLDSLGEAPDPPESVAGAHIVVAGGSSEPAWVRIQLLKGETELARCVGRPLAIHHSGPSGRDGFMIEGLHVADTLRGRGWGRYMLGRMHSELRERGYGSAVLGTEPANGPALLLYGNAGYRVICTEWTLERRL